MIDKTKMFCPFMSMRTTSIPTAEEIVRAQAEGRPPTITPTIAKCLPECGVYDHEHKCCGVLGLKMEFVKFNEGRANGLAG